MKHCPRCGLTKDRSEFTPSPSQPDGLHGWCRPCVAEHQRDRRAGTYVKRAYGGRSLDSRPILKVRTDETRDEAAVRLRDGGWTLREIGELLGVSWQRVQQLEARQRRAGDS